MLSSELVRVGSAAPGLGAGVVGELWFAAVRRDGTLWGKIIHSRGR